MILEHNQVIVPFEIKRLLWYVDTKLKTVVRLSVRGYQIYPNSIILECFIMDIPYRHTIHSVTISFNLLVEQMIFMDESEARQYLEKIILTN